MLIVCVVKRMGCARYQQQMQNVTSGKTAYAVLVHKYADFSNAYTCCAHSLPPHAPERTRLFMHMRLVKQLL